MVGNCSGVPNVLVNQSTYSGAMLRRVNLYVLLGITLLWLFMAFAVCWVLLMTENDSATNPEHWKSHKRDTCSEETERTSSALKSIELLQRKNKLLREKLRAINTRSAYKTWNGTNGELEALSFSASRNNDITRFEEARRRVENGVSEFWRYTSANLLRMADMQDKKALQSLSREMFIFLAQQKRAITRDLIQIEAALGLAEWKKQRSTELSKIVQSRFHLLQNPSDCATRKRFRCKMNKVCGFGCQIHHVAYCLIAGYALDRTVTLDSKNWQYSGNSWESVFLPISSCAADNAPANTWKDDAETEQQMLLDLPVIDNISEYTQSHDYPSWLPLAVPEDLFSPVLEFHKNPSVWWLSQVVSYLWKYQRTTKDFIEEVSIRKRFHSPVVGVHVRRTDKLEKEAARHEIEEYMRFVDEYYDQLETISGIVAPVKRIYLSSDDQSVLNECKTKFPHYDVIASVNTMLGAVPAKRSSAASLLGIITDIHFLSLSDYLVCTFSSQVCRLAYEIMQTRFPDATDRFKSLDDIYYFGGQNAHRMKAVLPHAARTIEEISFAQGDLLGIAGNLWNGTSVGEHILTLQKGRFPSYKAEEHFVTYNITRYDGRLSVGLPRPLTNAHNRFV